MNSEFQWDAKPDDSEARMWATCLHLSLFSGYVVPFAGFVAPIIIWQLKKTDIPEIDDHGKVVVNWMISSLIYGFVFVLMSMLLIGIPLLIALGIAGIVFPIIGAVKANDGEVWAYPLSMRFFS